jgi:tetratricopeptide (TPR) repeat protein
MKAGRVTKTIGWSLIVFLLAACASRKPAVAPPAAPRPRLEEKLAEADALFDRGGYVHLRRAFSIYRELAISFPDETRFVPGYAMTALLLAARAREMGIREAEPLAAARALIRSEEALSGLAWAADIVSLVSVKTLGVWDDGPTPDAVSGTRLADRDSPEKDFEASPGAPPFFAYLRALHQEQSGRTDGAKAGLDEALKTCPDSLLLKFKRAALPPPDGRLLEEIAEKDPEYYEALLGLAESAIAGGALITAEKHLLRAEEGVPESPLIAILLASVNFGTEEYDRSLAFYEETLKVAPAYKEALLGKAICLSCLGRSSEAVPILEDLLSRGPALQGECLYWLASNLHGLGDDERAAVEVEKAMIILPAAAVFTLAGTIALERGLGEAAEKDLKTAVSLDSGQSEAFFKLGQLYAQKSVWMDSALNYMFAGYGFENEEKAILTKISQIEESVMSDDRKARLLTRKKRQLETTRLTKATACYDAAAGYYNAGDPDRALIWARQAAAHPLFAEKAKAFLALIAARK